MLRYIGQRLLQMIPILLVVAILIFALLEALPGDPVKIMLGDTATPVQIEEERERLGLNEPAYARFFDFITKAVRLDFGESLFTGLSVGAELRERFPRTLTLSLISIAITVILGIPVGIWCAVKAGKLADKIWLFITLLANSMPSFWLSMLLVLLFSKTLGWLPSSGFGGVEYYILPAIATSMGSLASIARQTRGSMLEVIRMDYITTAKSKGISQREIILKHALPNALIPIITVIGAQFSFLLGGTTIVESVFSLPGIGLYILNGINNRDFPIVRGGVLLIAVTFSVLMLIIDIIYAFADPRIKAQYAAPKKKAQES